MKMYRSTLPLQNLCDVAHPDRHAGRIIDHDIPFATLERVELAVAIADQLLDAFRQFARMRFAAIENRDLVSARERITDLKRPGETGAAEDQNAQRFRRPLFPRAETIPVRNCSLPPQPGSR